MAIFNFYVSSTEGIEFFFRKLNCCSCPMVFQWFSHGFSPATPGALAADDAGLDRTGRSASLRAADLWLLGRGDSVDTEATIYRLIVFNSSIYVDTCNVLEFCCPFR